MRLSVVVALPLALGAATVAESPSARRLLLGIVLGAIAAGLYLWQGQ
jgi:hypothetical protein